MNFKLFIQLMAIIFITPSILNAQNQNNQWRYGSGGAINFNTGTPVSLSGSSILANEGSASIANRNTGILLFYTDGLTVWDSTNNVMQNGTGLLGGTPALMSSTTGAVIVPIPGSSTTYYIITIDEQNSNNGIHYNVVNMTLNGGLGGIVTGQKNIFLWSTISEKLHVVPSSDSLGYWLLSHQTVGNDFLAFKITSSGISSTPVISTVGGTQSNGAGHIKVNRQFNKLAIGNLFDGDIELFDFNNTTGVVSNPIIWNTAPGVTLVYGIEFSPDGTKLYTSDIDRIFQYDISSNNPLAIQNSEYLVTQNGAASLQLGPDDKIYTSGIIGAINCPNNASAACGYQDNVISNQNGGGGYGLPQWIYYPNDIPNATQTIIVANDTCLANGTNFSLSNLSGIQSINWNFGDPSSGANNTSTSLSPTHLFSTTGNYLVTANLVATCGNFQITYPLTIINCSTNCTGTISSIDTCLQNGTSFQVLSTNTINSINWNFGDPSSGANNASSSLTPTHLFSTTGTFNVGGIVNFSCGSDTIFETVTIINCDSVAKDCQIFIPNVFTPNNDGINDNFSPMTICKFDHFEFLI
ncbi:MAG: PKD domain-containing protein, partial [Ferruginibacter sp.]